MEINEADVGPEIFSMLQLAIAQRTKGLNKYGVAIEDANLSPGDLIQHAREELVDGAVYLTRLQRLIDAQFHQCRAEAVFGLMRELECVIESVKDNDPQFQLYAIEDWINSFGPVTVNVPKRVAVYVQPTVLDAWLERGDNLLTVSRTGAFPFIRKLELTL